MQIFIFMLMLLIVSGCGKSSKSTDRQLTTITEFDNEYDKKSGNILFVNMLVTTFIPEVDTLITQERREFFYDFDGNLIRVNEYEIDDITDDKVLYSFTLYEDLAEIRIWLSGNDTISYLKTTFDSMGKNILSLREWENSAYATKNFAVLYEYDFDGRLTKRSVSDFLTNEKEIFKYEHKMFNDTLDTRIYLNGSLYKVQQKINLPDRSVETSFMPSGELHSSMESIEYGDLRIEVFRFFEHHFTDSIYYKNDKEVRAVHISPDWHNVTITEYDIHGNPIIETSKSIR